MAWAGAGLAEPGDTELVSISANAPIPVGVPRGPSESPTISADGRFVAFASSADNFVEDDTNGDTDVFVYDRVAGITTRVSVSSAGEQSDKFSMTPGVSADGRLVVFSSRATNLFGNDTNRDNMDVFVHDRSTGSTVPASVSRSGGTGDDDSFGGTVSGDGRYVAFASLATDLVAVDTNDVADVFVRDTSTGITTRVSVASSGAQAIAGRFQRGSTSPAISADGRYVFFQSDAPNLVDGDTNEVPDVFMHDTTAGTTIRVNVGAGGEQPAPGRFGGGSGRPAISADGGVLAFVSAAPNLVVGDTNDVADVFVRERTTGTIIRIKPPAGEYLGSGSPALSADGRFVTFVSGTHAYVLDRDNGQITRLSVATAGSPGNGQSANPSISADGRYAVFQSAANNLVPGDTGDASDVFLRDRVARTTIRVEPVPVLIYGGNDDSDTRSGRALSADGRYAVFSSLASTLVSDDTNAASDAFVRDLASGETMRVSVDSTGVPGNGDSGGAAITPDGRYVVFHSDATNLVPGDTPGHRDVFVHDAVSGETARVSVDSAGQPLDHSTGWPDINADGRYVVFEKVGEDPPFELLRAAFVHDRVTGRTEQVRLPPPFNGGYSPSISADGRRLAVVATDDSGDWWVFVHDRATGTSSPLLRSFGFPRAVISPDGRFIVTSAVGRLTEAPVNIADQVYLFNIETRTASLISVDSGGNPGNGNSVAPSISTDGRYVAFHSEATNLVSDDTNGVPDVFVHDRISRTTVRVSVDGAGAEAHVPELHRRPGQPRPSSRNSSISGDGSRVLFTSDADNLTPLTPDTNVRSDVFLHELGPLPLSRPFAQSPAGLVSVEAEHFYIALPGQSHWRPLPTDDLLDPWRVIGDGAASGGEAIQADQTWPLTPGKRKSPVNGYSIEFNRAGPHYVWLRGRASSAQSDFLGLNLNWGPPLKRFIEPDTGQWVWNRGWERIEVPSPGVHQLWLYRHERGVEIDKIVITPDASFVPAGTGPAESPRAGLNHSPVLAPLRNRIVRAGDGLSLALSATDADGDLLTFSVPGLPASASLVDHGDGSATLMFPVLQDIGTRAFRVVVTDSGLPPVSDEETFELKVVAAAFLQAPGGILTVEAEHFDANVAGSQVGPWTVFTDTGAATGHAIRAAGRWARSPIDEAPSHTEYDVDFDRGGKHFVWVRARSLTPMTDAFYVGLDDGRALVQHTHPSNGQWVWFRSWQPLQVEAPGLHTLRVYRLERLAEVDKIVVTPWAEFAPSTTGPPESPRQ
jgi:Tol biopolymer transport system component